MFLSHKRIVPRWKEWQPLVTHQLRLRSLLQIIGINLGAEDLEGKICGGKFDDCKELMFYYTLHVTAMSAPFYTSEKLTGSCPKWKEIDPCFWESTDVFGGIDCFVLRLWMHHNPQDEIVKVLGIHMSGLMYLGPNLRSISLPSHPNCVLFLLPGGYYTTCDLDTPSKSFTAAATTSHIRPSYSLSVVNRLSSVQKAISDTQAETRVIKQKIVSGEFMTSDRRSSAALRKIMNKNRPRSTQADIIQLKENIEIARYRVELLDNEKRRTMARLTASKGRLEILCDGNQVKESRTMENYRILQKSVLKHREWLALHVQRRETQLHSKALLNFRIKQLISELHCIYAVQGVGDKYTICGVHLPDSEHLTTVDDVQLSVALGYVSHAVLMVSSFLQVPLRYPVTHVGSRSRITDLIATNLPDNEREFPLFSKGKDKLLFKYAVYLINKNIAALRLICGLGTRDLRLTLANLAGLLNISGEEVALPTSPSSSTREASTSVSISSPTHIVPRYKTPISVTPNFSMGRPTDTGNISCSLDKGLNEIEKYTSPNMGGSESKLFIAEDASRYMHNWQTHKSIVSDEESDQGRPGMFSEKTVSGINITHARKISFGQEVYDDSCVSENTLLAECSAEDAFSVLQNQALEAKEIEPEAISAVLETNTKLLVDAVEKAWSEATLEKPSIEKSEERCEVSVSEIVEKGGHQVGENSSEVASSVQLVAKEVVETTSPRQLHPISECSGFRTHSHIERIYETGDHSKLPQVSIDTEAAEAVVFDTLQDDVANRAEALSNHSTSFNMFRSRLRSRSEVTQD